MVSAAKA